MAQATGTTVKLKIRLGGALVKRNIPASSAPARAEDGPSSSQQALGNARERAQSNRAVLAQYAPPSASPESILASLTMGMAVPKELLRPWNSSLALPVAVSEDRPSKRAKGDAGQPVAAEAACTAKVECSEPAATAGAREQQEAPKKRRAPEHSGQPCKDKQQEVAMAEGGPGAMHPPGSASSSDHATTSQFQLPSPEDAEHKGQMGSARPAATAAAAADVAVAQQGLCERRADGAAPGPSSERQQQQQQQQRRQGPPSMAVQAQAQNSTLVPLSLFELGSLGVLPQAFSTVTPFDLQMPPMRVQPAHRVTEQLVSETVHAASLIKRQGDAERARAGAADGQRAAFRERAGIKWTVPALSRYAEAALKYMEACEYMLRLPGGPDRIDKATSRERAARLYNQTNDLLQHAARAVESAIGSELSKEALRILLEKLCAVCTMREAAQQPQLLISLAADAKRLVQRQQQLIQHAQQQQQNHPAGASGGASTRQGPNSSSPDDSTTSSQDVLAQQRAAAAAGTGAHAAGGARLGGGGMPPPPQQVGLTPEVIELQRKLAMAARHVVRFGEVARRSAAGFQTFIERPDVQASQQAKLACMHMAAVSMDMGMADGFRLVTHAGRALAHIRQL